MKTKLLCLLLLAVLRVYTWLPTPVCAQTHLQSIGFDRVLGSSDPLPGPQPKAPAQIRQFGTNYYSTATSTGWLRVIGKVLEVRPHEGLRLDGLYMDHRTLQTLFKGEIFLVNYPFQNTTAEGDKIGWDLTKPPVLARDAGVHQFNTLEGYVRTFHKLDCGKPWTPPARAATARPSRPAGELQNPAVPASKQTHSDHPAVKTP